MNLIYFNLCLDSEYAPLEFNIKWLNTLSKDYDNIFVITKYTNNILLSTNIKVYPLLKAKNEKSNKLILLIRFYFNLFKILNHYKIDRCFSHMNPLYVVLSGLILRIKKIKILLWYTHPSVTLKLKIAYYLSNKILTASENSFRFKRQKVKAIGHFIDDDIFNYNLLEKRVNQIVYAGRISKIKKVHYIVELFNELQKRWDLKLKIIGDCFTDQDKQYKKSIQKFIDENHLKNKVEFHNSINRSELSSEFNKSLFSINATKLGSFDKVIFESIFCGCLSFVLDPNISKIFSSNDQFLLSYFIEKDVKKISNFLKLSKQKKEELINNSLDRAKENFSIKSLNKVIEKEFIS